MSLNNLTNNREDMTVPESGLDCSAVMNKNKKNFYNEYRHKTVSKYVKINTVYNFRFTFLFLFNSVYLT